LSYPDAIINSRVYSCCVALEQTLAAYVLASIFYSIQISNNSIRNIVFSYALVQEFLVYINGFTFLIFRRNWLFVCLSSVCLSVKLVHPYAGIESKQLNVSSNFFFTTWQTTILVFTTRRVCIARTMAWQDVCLSVYHTPVLCVNGYTYPQFFSPSRSPPF